MPVRSRKLMDITAVAATIAAIVAAGLSYISDRTGPWDAQTARAMVGEHTRTLAGRLGLRSPATLQVATGQGITGMASWKSEQCGVWQGGRQRTSGAHMQHSVQYVAAPPPGRRATELAKDAEEILRDSGYRIVTDAVAFATAPPPGTVLARWGWGDALEITLWPDPRADTVKITGTARCLPID